MAWEKDRQIAWKKYLGLIRFRIEKKIPVERNPKFHHFHHIYPRCLHLRDERKNKTVLLTVREHMFAHYYLWKAWGDGSSGKNMKLAFMGLFRTVYGKTYSKGLPAGEKKYF